LCDTDNKEGSQEIGEILEEIKENLPQPLQRRGEWMRDFKRIKD
jgi:hypothetical protein